MRAYVELLHRILDTGVFSEDRTGVGTLRRFGDSIEFDLREGFPLLTLKYVPLRWVFEELRWFLSGSGNEFDLRDRGVDIWKEWATAEKCAEFGREGGDLGPVYGVLWRSYPAVGGGVDQIVELMEQIDSNPFSRRLIVCAWHPKEQRNVHLPPCHTLFQLGVFPDTQEMSLHMYQRSCDTFLGLPFNIASYALLLHMICHATGYVPAKLRISFGDVHIYTNHLDQVGEMLVREEFELPSVEIRTEKHLFSHMTLLNTRWEDVVLTNYRHHPAIKADVAV